MPTKARKLTSTDRAREGAVLRGYLDRAGHRQVRELVELLTEIDGHIARLPGTALAAAQPHLGVLKLQLAEHRRWVELLAQVPEASTEPQADADPAPTDATGDGQPALPVDSVSA